MRLKTVYIELIFLDNFMINWLIILIASTFTKAKKKWGRYACAAGVGGVYACVVFGTTGVAVSLLTKVAVSLLMCFIAYYSRSEKGFLKNTCAFYVTSFVFAGAIYAIMHSMGEAAVLGGAIVVRPLIRTILLGLGAGAVLIIGISRVHQRTLQREQHTEFLILSYEENEVRVKAFYDTGNMATEPLSGCGIVFVTNDTARALFDTDTLDLMKGNGEASTDRLRMIPCMTAAGQHIFFGIQIDSVRHKGQKDGVKAVVCIAQGTIADGCDAIIGSNIMDELKKGAHNEKISGKKNHDLDIDKVENQCKRGLHQRERGAAAAVVTEGGSGPAGIAGARGQDSSPCID